MAAATVSPDLEEPQTSPQHDGLPGSSLVRGERNSNAPLNQVSLFDHVAAYEALQQAKAAVRKLYSDKNIDHTDALEVLEAAQERLKASREKPKRYRKVNLGGEMLDPQDEVKAWLQESGNELEEGERLINDPDLCEDDQGLQGSFWGWDDSNEHPYDRGTEIGKGGPVDEQNERAVERENREKGIGEVRSQRATQQWAERDEDENNSNNQTKEEWETISNVSAPNSLFDENVISAKEDHLTAKRFASAIWEEMRLLRTQENRYQRMILDLQKQFPNLRGYVGKHKSNKRKADSTFDGTFEADPPAKRARTGVPYKFKMAVHEWHMDVTRVLKNHSTLEEFPAPVAWDCADYDVCRLTAPSSSSENNTHRHLRACEHNILDAITSLSARQLKRYLTLFHPDRFSRCRADKRETWQALANEVFVVLSDVWDEQLGKTDPNHPNYGKGCSCGFADGGSRMGT